MIGLITFDCPHQKTAEIIERCSKNISCILTIPFKERPKRKVLIKHRPYQLSGPTPQDIGKAFSIDVIPLELITAENNNDFDELIVGGAGILSDFIVKKFKVINSHPGLIPMTRGLDSFKWAIYFKEILGITIHQINTDVDLGVHIHHSKTKTFEGDTLLELSNRHYRNEVDCLCEYIKGSLEMNIISNLKCKDSRMRMSYEKERIVVSKFEEYLNWAKKFN